MTPSLIGAHWTVRPIEHAAAVALIEANHYAKGASRTSVYRFGLFHFLAPEHPLGATLWLPPTKVAAQSVDRERWQKVLALSRMAVAPGVPKNACSFMLGHAVRHIRKDRRFVALVTYADESQGHDGHVYRASGWEYVGRTGSNPRWVDPRTGRQVASQATRTRTVAQMRALGYVQTGRFHKHKFVRRLC